MLRTQAIFILLAGSIIGCGGDPVAQLTPPAGQKAVAFTSGHVAFFVPDSYEQSAEPDGTIVLHPKEGDAIVLRLSLHTFDDQDVPDDIGVQLVQSQGEERDIELTNDGGKVILAEVKNETENGKAGTITFRQIGFQDVVVVMSISVEDARKDEPYVAACEEQVPSIISSLTRL